VRRVFNRDTHEADIQGIEKPKVADLFALGRRHGDEWETHLNRLKAKQLLVRRIIQQKN
jgi:hypothetical protein